MAICKNCGQEFANEAKFCTRCGARNDGGVDAAAPKATIEPDVIGKSAPTPPPVPPRVYQSANYSAPPPAAPSAPKEQINTTGVMVWSVITLLCCNVGAVLGMFAVVFSIIAGVEKDYNSEKAKKYLYYAKVCNIVALIVGIVFSIIFGAIMATYISVLLEILEQLGATPSNAMGM